MNVQIIGKVSATEKNPSTMDEFYFWTRAGFKLNTFDVVKVHHLENSITYGVVQSINHVTDSTSHMASYISSDFGDLSETHKGNTNRLQFNYVKVQVVGNTKNIYTPVLHDSCVETCDVSDIQVALGLKEVKNPLRCGYLEMYDQKVPVDINANFVVGPDGAHLNISGISGLACKTSYCMFLLNSLQQKYSKMSPDDDDYKSVAYVIFNVKGQDLLSIDEKGSLSETDKKIYDEDLQMSATPFKNVRFFYPYSDSKESHHVQTFGNWDAIVSKQMAKNKASIFKYTFNACKEKLSYIFANEEDSTGQSNTMESIISYIENEREPFIGISSWETLLKKIKYVLETKDCGARSDIALSSWKKFSRIINKVISDKVFNDNLTDEAHELIMAESLREIKPNEVCVIDIARLEEKSQSFVFGDIMETLHEMMSAKNIPGMPDKIVVFVDELNKYASTDIPKSSPILRQLLEITERGRSLGLILFSVEQFRSAINDRITGNCATAAYGRTNYVEAAKSDVRSLKEITGKMTRLTPGEYIIQNPALRSLVNIKFPHPTYKENK